MEHVRHNSLKDTIDVEAIKGVSNLKGEPERMCRPCQLGEQVRTPHLEPQLGYVCVDDFSKFTWVNFLETKSEAFEELWQILYNEHNNILLDIGRIRSDHGNEFRNS